MPSATDSPATSRTAALTPTQRTGRRFRVPDPGNASLTRRSFTTPRMSRPERRYPPGPRFPSRAYLNGDRSGQEPPQPSHRHMVVTMPRVALLAATALVVGCANSSKSPEFISGPYRALTPSGQTVTIELDLKAQTGELDWAKEAGIGPGVSLTATTSDESITLRLRNGLKATGEATTSGGIRSFRLTYRQRSDGEPDSGSPLATLTFTIIPSTDNHQ